MLSGEIKKRYLSGLSRTCPLPATRYKEDGRGRRGRTPPELRSRASWRGAPRPFRQLFRFRFEKQMRSSFSSICRPATVRSSPPSWAPGEEPTLTGDDVQRKERSRESPRFMNFLVIPGPCQGKHPSLSRGSKQQSCAAPAWPEFQPQGAHIHVERPGGDTPH